MGAIKENAYTFEETTLFYVGRAFAHPARVRMITEILSKESLKNVDLSEILKLAKPTIKNHIDILKDAEMVEINYFMHYYAVSLSEKGQKWRELLLQGKDI